MTDDYSKLSKALTQAVNEIIGSENTGRADGTATYYIAGKIGNKKVCHTKQRTWYNGKKGFYSWIQTHYKNGKVKRTKFARSGSKAKAEARAERLLKELELDYHTKSELNALLGGKNESI